MPQRVWTVLSGTVVAAGVASAFIEPAGDEFRINVTQADPVPVGNADWAERSVRRAGRQTLTVA